MKTELSILIPTYNNDCVDIVKALSAQAKVICGLRYEIIVADDGSTIKSVIETNRQINSIDNCQYITSGHNVGRAAIRNILSQSAHYKWLLYVDSGINIFRRDFLMRYLLTEDSDGVVYGGLSIMGSGKDIESNLRYMYEKKCEIEHSTERRLQRQYKSFRTVNFLVYRATMTAIPFNTEIKEYGYEDVMWGKSLKDNHFSINHIDNPVEYKTYDDNETYVAKTEEALRTLHKYKEEMCGYSNLLRVVESLKRYDIMNVFLTYYLIKRKSWRKKLCGRNPSVMIYNLYRIGYLLSIL